MNAPVLPNSGPAMPTNAAVSGFSFCLQVDPGADEWNEGWQSNIQPTLPRGDVMPHLVHQQEQYEAYGILPTEELRVNQHGQQHRAGREQNLAQFSGGQQREQRLQGGSPRARMASR